jgi:Cu2+-exporting ATPase
MRPDPHEVCFHCGLPLPAGIDYRVVVDEVARPMCCAGCAAVAQSIVAAGLGDYYRNREALPGAGAVVPDFLDELAVYDLPQMQNGFVHRNADNFAEAAFLLEGVRCAACVWLIERHLRQLPGTLEVNVNYATRRMRVRWDATRIKLSRVLAAVAEIGYRARPFDPKQAEVARVMERRRSLKRLAIAALCMMQVMMLALPTYLADEGDIAADHNQLLRWASLLLTLPVLLFSAQEFFVGAWRDLQRRHLGMDVPIALGIITAFAASAWSTLSGRGDVYFDSVTMFVFLLLGARFLEQEARSRAGDALERLTRILPAHCRRFDDYPASRVTHALATAQLTTGDHLLIGTGERIPADGTVVEGSGEADESLVSGESRPVGKRPGASMMAGAVNLGSPLVMRATQVGAQSTVAQISRLVDRALGEKPQIARMADRAASWFVLGLLAVTAIAAASWWSIDVQRVLPVVIALLVIACPCALGLATPAALTAATHRLVRRGLLPTRGHALETLAKVTDIVFDKTGTLTRGTPTIVRTVLLGTLGETEVTAIAAALEASSKHPLGKALCAAATRRVAATELITRPGSGVQGIIDGVAYRVGTPEFVRGITHTAAPVEPHDAPCTLVALGSEQGWLALFHFADILRPESRAVVEELQAMGKTVHLLSGDSPGMVAQIAIQAGLEHGRGGALPADKLDYIRALQAEGAVVAMVGDGVNDGPSLGGAQVSIAMGSGTDVAQSAADMVLLSSDLSIIPEALRIAQSTRRVIRQNLAWAAGYNLVAVLFAAFGMVTPSVAAVGMSVSSLIVVGNALRLAPMGPNRMARPATNPTPEMA